jgi:hypothetical protein
MTEEIDVAGLSRSVVTIVGECKWTNDKMGLQVLIDFDTYKIPAMRESKVRFAKDGPRIVLFSRSGFKGKLVDAAGERSDVTLLSPSEIVDALLADQGRGMLAGVAPRGASMVDELLAERRHEAAREDRE